MTRWAQQISLTAPLADQREDRSALRMSSKACFVTEESRRVSGRDSKSGWGGDAQSLVSTTFTKRLSRTREGPAAVERSTEEDEANVKKSGAPGLCWC